jgi:hypothetical protein
LKKDFPRNFGELAVAIATSIAVPFSWARLSLMGIRTGVASGKNPAKTAYERPVRERERLPGWAR